MYVYRLRVIFFYFFFPYIYIGGKINAQPLLVDVGLYQRPERYVWVARCFLTPIYMYWDKINAQPLLVDGGYHPGHALPAR